MKRYYIQLETKGRIETVDEYSTRKDAEYMLKIYRKIRDGVFRISSRACKDWVKLCHG